MSLAYRFRQRVSYRLGKDPTRKKLYGLNRDGEVVRISGDRFSFPGHEASFSLENKFLAERPLVLRRLVSSGQFHFEDAGNAVVCITGSLRIKVWTAEELSILCEVFLDRCYDISCEGDYWVVDVGANIGVSTLFYANNDSVQRVYAYEPFPETFAALDENLRLNAALSRQKVVATKVGLWSRSDQVEAAFNAEMRGKNSVSQQCNGGITAHVKLQRASRVLRSIADNRECPRILVKLDCEGTEFEIFEELNASGIPRKVFGFVVEWHGRQPDQIVRVLLAEGFSVHRTGGSDIGYLVAFR